MALEWVTVTVLLIFPLWHTTKMSVFCHVMPTITLTNGCSMVMGKAPIVLLVMGISQLCTLLPMIFLKKEHTCMHIVSAETMFLLELEGTALNPLIINSPVL